MLIKVEYLEIRTHSSDVTIAGFYVTVIITIVIVIAIPIIVVFKLHFNRVYLTHLLQQFIVLEIIKCLNLHSNLSLIMKTIFFIEMLKQCL